MTHDELAERIEALEGILAVEQGKALIYEARALIFPRPKQTRVPKQANGEPWGGDGIGPYTEEYKAWAEADKRFRAYMDAGAFLDAAMTLVPEGWSVGQWSVIGKPDSCQVFRGAEEVLVSAATPALALCAAALRARNT